MSTSRARATLTLMFYAVLITATTTVSQSFTSFPNELSEKYGSLSHLVIGIPTMAVPLGLLLLSCVKGLRVRHVIWAYVPVAVALAVLAFLPGQGLMFAIVTVVLTVVIGALSVQEGVLRAEATVKTGDKAANGKITGWFTVIQPFFSYFPALFAEHFDAAGAFMFLALLAAASLVGGLVLTRGAQTRAVMTEQAHEGKRPEQAHEAKRPILATVAQFFSGAAVVAGLLSLAQQLSRHGFPDSGYLFAVNAVGIPAGVAVAFWSRRMQSAPRRRAKRRTTIEAGMRHSAIATVAAALFLLSTAFIDGVPWLIVTMFGTWAMLTAANTHGATLFDRFTGGSIHHGSLLTGGRIAGVGAGILVGNLAESQAWFLGSPLVGLVAAIFGLVVVYLLPRTPAVQQEMVTV